MEALVYFAIWAALIFVMMRFGCGAHVMGHGQSDGRSTNAREAPKPLRWVPTKTDIDPVCGKAVQTDKAKSAVHDGTVYYFCSRECRERFETAPELYLGGGDARQPRLEHSHV